ncbi:MAG TPA: GNAT family N-acetyltransferase [Planosporangium sp.]|jgi:RimJ/RimL family protein N-acetyltransferase|nr:GNAT family N-acetyltransferase [Planosporangium sp.]
MIDTVRLRLTAVRPSDVDDLHEIFSGTTAQAGDAGAFSVREETRAWVRRRMEAAREHGLAWYVLRDRRTGELIGNCGLFAGRTGPVEPEIGYEIVRAHRRKGYATEAVLAVLAEADAAGVARVWATVRPRNAGSLRVAAKIGMVYSHSELDERGDLLYFTRPRPGTGEPGRAGYGRG